MVSCAICESNDGKQKCQLEGAKVCIECCLKVRNVHLCKGCKYFNNYPGSN